MKLTFITIFSLFLFTEKMQSQEDCPLSNAQIDLYGNQTRSRLSTDGTMWLDEEMNGSYFSRSQGLSSNQPSSIGAGGIWMGGISPDGEIKAAIRRSNDFVDRHFRTGPLSMADGTTDATQCRLWDRFFVVTSDEIKKHRQQFELSLSYLESEIPFGVKNWPAKGNPFFSEIFEFELPDTPQGLADFFDNNKDGKYNPLDGDYPALFQDGCDAPSIPDQMIFWIFSL